MPFHTSPLNALPTSTLNMLLFFTPYAPPHNYTIELSTFLHCTPCQTSTPYALPHFSTVHTPFHTSSLYALPHLNTVRPTALLHGPFALPYFGCVHTAMEKQLLLDAALNSVHWTLLIEHTLLLTQWSPDSPLKPREIASAFKMEWTGRWWRDSGSGGHKRHKGNSS